MDVAERVRTLKEAKTEKAKREFAVRHKLDDLQRRANEEMMPNRQKAADLKKKLAEVDSMKEDGWSQQQVDEKKNAINKELGDLDETYERRMLHHRSAAKPWSDELETLVKDQEKLDAKLALYEEMPPPAAPQAAAPAAPAAAAPASTA
jgi:chromosome segregation ATPase